jgi:hypothetical protein
MVMLDTSVKRKGLLIARIGATLSLVWGLFPVKVAWDIYTGRCHCDSYCPGAMTWAVR